MAHHIIKNIFKQFQTVHIGQNFLSGKIPRFFSSDTVGNESEIDPLLPETTNENKIFTKSRFDIPYSKEGDCYLIKEFIKNCDDYILHSENILRTRCGLELNSECFDDVEFIKLNKTYKLKEITNISYDKRGYLIVIKPDFIKFKNEITSAIKLMEFPIILSFPDDFSIYIEPPTVTDKYKMAIYRLAENHIYKVKIQIKLEHYYYRKRIELDLLGYSRLIQYKKIDYHEKTYQNKLKSLLASKVTEFGITLPKQSWYKGRKL